MSVAPFAYESDGGVLVCGDGPELFAYSGEDDSPMWKQFCEGLLVGVGVAKGTVCSLDDGGGFNTWKEKTGEKVLSVALGSPAIALQVSDQGTAVALLSTGVAHIQENGEFSTIPFQGGTALACSGDASRVVVGMGSGDLALFDLASGTQLSTAQVGAPVADIAWSPRGYWMVAAGTQLHMVAWDLAMLDPEAEEGTPPPDPLQGTIEVPGTPHRVAVNVDGAVVACDDGAQKVLVFELHEKRCGTTIEYTRDIGDLDFGPDTSLGIGLEYADANRVDVVGGQMTRTAQGLGRGSEPWFPRINADSHIMRGAIAAMRA
ncbi:MAG: hypothetical protein JRI25_05380, partial [Deltaproteobacteria bacterium]|nr:hypothetical protein [Deltaproteobacteria bacterium]